MPRVYERRFDHEEARRLRAEGWTLASLAKRYGVTDGAVYLATTPEDRERRLAYKKSWRTTTCEECGGPAMKLVGGKKTHNHDGRILCNHCRGVAKRESVRFDESGKLAAVRCMALDCANGERWQPPEHFTRGKRYPDLREGGIHNHCRACQTRARQAYRERHKVPCVHCGEPTLSQNEKTAGGRTASDLCRSCWAKARTRRRVAA